MEKVDKKLGLMLVRDELFDLELYKRLQPRAGTEMAKLLGELIPVETRHLARWQSFFEIPEPVALDIPRRIKFSVLIFFCRLFGDTAIGLSLEAIELAGIKKYLRVWEQYRDAPLGEEVRAILQDELEHEESAISQNITRKVYPEHVRDLFLGLNDGLVEMLGAISGFFAAFQSLSAVLVAAFMVTVAGAISMAAGAFMGVSSAREMQEISLGKAAFLGQRPSGAEILHPFRSAALVGISYFLGTLVPIIPVFFGEKSFYISIIVSALAVILVSYVLAFLSGMEVRRRILLNLIIVAIAVSVTYGIGILANQYFGVHV